MNILKSLLSLLWNYFGLILVWILVFGITAAVVSTLIQNRTLKKNLGALPAQAFTQSA
jgi:hypothetical protein